MAAAGFAAVPLEPAAAVAAAAADDPPAAAEPSCRVCWEEADGEDGGALLTPCECLGTQRFVHQRCLQEWMQHAPPDTRMVCGVCRTAYMLPPGFEVPPTNYDPQQLQQQVWQDVEEAFAEAQHQEQRWRPRPPWPLGLTLLCGGVVAAVVAAAVASVRLAEHEQRRQREAERQQRRQERKQLQERRTQLEAECSQLKRWLTGLRALQQLERRVPPPLVPGQRRRDHVQLVLTAVQLAHDLGLKLDLLGRYEQKIAACSGSARGSGSGRGRARGNGSGSGSGEDTPQSRRSRPRSRPERGRQQGGRQNVVAPLLRAMHGLLPAAGHQ